MEFYLLTIPEESRIATFLSSLDDYVFDAVTSLGITPMTELNEAIACLKTEFEPVRNVIVA